VASPLDGGLFVPFSLQWILSFDLRATLTPMHFSLHNFVRSSLRVVGSPCWILGYTIIFIFPRVWAYFCWSLVVCWMLVQYFKPLLGSYLLL
jgi:hypothetical protein